jgi:hypothetical protein
LDKHPIDFDREKPWENGKPRGCLNLADANG